MLVREVAMTDKQKFIKRMRRRRAIANIRARKKNQVPVIMPDGSTAFLSCNIMRLGSALAERIK